MGGYVDLSNVEAWLKKNGATIKSDQGDHETRNVEVVREVGRLRFTTTINAQSVTRERADGSGVSDRTPFQVLGDRVAIAAADLRIDATQVLGPNWTNEYRDQALALERNVERDRDEGKGDRLRRGRSGSLSDPPEGPFKTERAPGEPDGDGEVR